MRRDDDRYICATVSPDEHALITVLARREQLTLSELIRRALNSMAEESGDEAIFIEPRHRGRKRLA
jgi:hypothetical protein